jgi:hypothetical protein
MLCELSLYVFILLDDITGITDRSAKNNCDGYDLIREVENDRLYRLTAAQEARSLKCYRPHNGPKTQ